MGLQKKERKKWRINERTRAIKNGKNSCSAKEQGKKTGEIIKKKSHLICVVRQKKDVTRIIQCAVKCIQKSTHKRVPKKKYEKKPTYND